MAFATAYAALGDLGAAHTWTLGAIDDALTLGQPHGLGVAVSWGGAELLSVLGESQRLAPVLGRLEALPAPSIRGVRDAWLAVAECALASGQFEAARVAQRRVREAIGPECPHIDLRIAIADANWALAESDTATALTLLPRDDARGHSHELRWRALTVRLRAEAVRGGCAPATLAAADAALQRDGVHARAALLLHQALLQAAPTAARRHAWQQRVGRLARTLDGLPRLRARFEQRWLGAT